MTVLPSPDEPIRAVGFHVGGLLALDIKILEFGQVGSVLFQVIPPSRHPGMKEGLLRRDAFRRVNVQ